MYGWPEWLYWIWAQAIRLVLLPIVLPVRIWETWETKMKINMDFVRGTIFGIVCFLFNTIAVLMVVSGGSSILTVAGVSIFTISTLIYVGNALE